MQRNIARRAEEARALFDGYAHYRQTVELAEEQVEEVTKFRTTDARTGEPVDGYIFLGVQYATRARGRSRASCSHRRESPRVLHGTGPDLSRAAGRARRPVRTARADRRHEARKGQAASPLSSRGSVPTSPPACRMKNWRSGGIDVDDSHAEIAAQAQRRDVVRHQPVDPIGRGGEREAVEPAPALVALEHIAAAEIEAETRGIEHGLRQVPRHPSARD